MGRLSRSSRRQQLNYWPSMPTCALFGCLHAVDRGRARLDARDEFSAEFCRIVHWIEAADEERADPQPVVFKDRLSDLFGRADETRGVAERAGRLRNRHPQALVMNIALQSELHQPLAGIVDWSGCLFLSPPSLPRVHRSEDAIGLLPRGSLGIGDDGANRDVEPYHPSERRCLR